MPNDPTILELHITDAKDNPMATVDTVSAVAGRGLMGDRYYYGTGHYSNIAGWGAQVTLIQHEAIQAINTGYDTDFTGAMMRRNIVTQNIKLDSLIGRSFRCGQARASPRVWAIVRSITRRRGRWVCRTSRRVRRFDSILWCDEAICLRVD